MGEERIPSDIWQDELMAAVEQFAEALKYKDETVPWLGHETLTGAMQYLMTELWDRGFSSPEIEKSFKAALENLQSYAAGER
ncbi:MAG: hypothetical protein APF82_09380 [Sphingomonadales bacterium BRH_c42]|nr:MAG: hypothetical protein APF82_09380 [Sphingomonadales bacterium BRH_c42]